MKIGEEAIPTERVGKRAMSTRSVLIVMLDIYAHPDTTVGEIATRTGLPQSAVSACVARLRETGSVVTATDPRDRRRTLVRQNPEVNDRRAEVASTTVDAALATALGTDDPVEVAQVVALLEALDRRLSPESLTRLTPDAG
ncbi:MarR family transcriptional regulator [Streptomyces antimicrobicus]|uniref:MarR family transcriptional regulator n=1 Tax=Streptomyces antimicrobicus TaxID=2883108 RepID=A0ABS8BEY2_9ACTN|nr:MarR family transcriptional regulator [Streptomyces antimicrobicus]MCB5183200.1 MarR family transcriptional regulator [Streptomyces antimicrobicus]